MNRPTRPRVLSTSLNEVSLNLHRTDASRLADNHGSTSSLETNAESYQPPRLSESLRGLFQNEDDRGEKTDNNKDAEMSIITEESENEIETEFGPEIETNLGPDADLSSIDEEL